MEVKLLEFAHTQIDNGVRPIMPTSPDCCRYFTEKGNTLSVYKTLKINNTHNSLSLSFSLLLNGIEEANVACGGVRDGVYFSLQTFSFYRRRKWELLLQVGINWAQCKLAMQVGIDWAPKVGNASWH